MHAAAAAAAHQPSTVPRLPGINMLFVIGGNGGNAAAHAIAKECRKQGVLCNVVGVPKSIDNGELEAVATRGQLERAMSDGSGALCCSTALLATQLLRLAWLLARSPALRRHPAHRPLLRLRHICRGGAALAHLRSCGGAVSDICSKLPLPCSAVAASQPLRCLIRTLTMAAVSADLVASPACRRL